MSLEVINLCKIYGRGEKAQTVLSDLCFTVEQGELVALAGKKRSGKTVLLNILAGIDRPTSGEVLLDGCRVGCGTFFRLGKHRSRNVGIVTREPMLLPELTVQENVAMPLMHRLTSAKTRRKLARSALRMVGMREKANVYPHALTPYEKQLVCTARAIVHNPKYVLCDEPTACMESFEVEKYMQVLEVISAATGCAVLVATYTRRVAALCRRIIPVSGISAPQAAAVPEEVPEELPNHTLAGTSEETPDGSPVGDPEFVIETGEPMGETMEYVISMPSDTENSAENVKIDDIDIEFETVLKNNINNMF